MPRRPATTNGSSPRSSSTLMRARRRRPSTAVTSCHRCCRKPPLRHRPLHPASPGPRRTRRRTGDRRLVRLPARRNPAPDDGRTHRNPRRGRCVLPPHRKAHPTRIALAHRPAACALRRRACVRRGRRPTRRRSGADCATVTDPLNWLSVAPRGRGAGAALRLPRARRAADLEASRAAAVPPCTVRISLNTMRHRSASANLP